MKEEQSESPKPRTKRPQIVRDAGLDIHWDSKKIWKLDIPVTEMDMQDLIWHFEIPFWEKDDTDDWNLTPQEVIDKVPGSTEHQKKVEKADLQYPIEIMWNKGRWFILDGIHRLVKAYNLGMKTMKVRIVPPEKMGEILVDDKIG